MCIYKRNKNSFKCLQDGGEGKEKFIKNIIFRRGGGAGYYKFHDPTTLNEKRLTVLLCFFLFKTLIFPRVIKLDVKF